MLLLISIDKYHIIFFRFSDYSEWVSRSERHTLVLRDYLSLTAPGLRVLPAHHSKLASALAVYLEVKMNNSSWTLNISQLPSWFGAIQAFIFAAILVNNILVTFQRMKKLTMLHHFMIGLCVADLVTALPYSIVFFTTVNGSITLTQSLCDTWGVMFMVTIATTTWIHSAMCIEKCISILHPILHRNFQKSKHAA